jgi:hypothetical protein
MKANHSPAPKCSFMSKHSWRFDVWVAGWLDILCGAISVMTFTFYRPIWDLSFRCWISKRRLRQSLQESNAVVQENLRKTSNES